MQSIREGPLHEVGVANFQRFPRQCVWREIVDCALVVSQPAAVDRKESTDDIVRDQKKAVGSFMVPGAQVRVSWG